MLARKTPMRRTAFKKKPRKKRHGHDKLMLEACRGQDCWLCIPGVCLLIENDRTVVAAHRNEGKGMGMKTPDKFTVPACNLCHFAYDQGGKLSKEEKRELWDSAYRRWSAYRDSACTSAGE